MARLRRPSFESVDESEVTGYGNWTSRQATTPSKTRASPRKQANKVYEDPDSSDLASSTNGLPKLVAKTPTSGARQLKQIRLAPLNAATTSKPPPVFDWPTEQRRRSRRPTSPLKYQNDDSPDGFSDNDQDSTEDSVWRDPPQLFSDESDEELPSPSKVIKRPLKSKASMLQLRRSLKDLRHMFKADDLASVPPVPTMKPASPAKDVSRPTSSSSDKENGGDHMLHFSPPRLHSPRKSQARASTPPPTSPLKGKLTSPSKKKTKIPTPPHRPSLDTFWDAEVVNDWNDKHSPKKEWKSPAKLQQARDDAATSPTSSPRKSQSPTKRTKAEMEAKKAWESRKYELAESFLVELDHKIANGQVAQLAASTGGVRLIWSKTLNSTAGRANWKRQTTKTRELDGSSTVTYQHHASIELAEKVIDDEDRLLNVIAHEFCHLCNFIISGIKDQPHGRQFKEWGLQATKAFADRGVEVTTKHRYQIEYKYIWRCENDGCGAEFKRHSKSIDTQKHTCGACRGKLLQIRPVPRKDAGSSGYAAFVKSNFAAVRKGLPMGSTQKEAMKAVAQLYREQKKTTPEVKELIQDDAEDEVEKHDSGSFAADEDVENMARMLDSVTIQD